MALCTTFSLGSNFSHLNFVTTLCMKTSTTILAYSWPGHIRGPPPNGVKVNGGGPFPSNLDGSNCFGFGKCKWHQPQYFSSNIPRVFHASDILPNGVLVAWLCGACLASEVIGIVMAAHSFVTVVSPAVSSCLKVGASLSL
ncbi:hypothetical protein RJ640_015950, partial [Escallonia rubra]